MKKLDILLVEDSEHDIMFIEEALHDAEVINHLVSVRNGEEALNFLHKKTALYRCQTSGSHIT